VNDWRRKLTVAAPGDQITAFDCHRQTRAVAGPSARRQSCVARLSRRLSAGSHHADEGDSDYSRNRRKAHLGAGVAGLSAGAFARSLFGSVGPHIGHRRISPGVTPIGRWQTRAARRRLAATSSFHGIAERLGVFANPVITRHN
jgi:hypothetical protein